MGATAVKKLIEDATHWSLAWKWLPETTSMPAVRLLGHRHCVEAVVAVAVAVVVVVSLTRRPTLDETKGIAPSFMPQRQ